MVIAVSDTVTNTKISTGSGRVMDFFTPKVWAEITRT